MRERRNHDVGFPGNRPRRRTPFTALHNQRIQVGREQIVSQDANPRGSQVLSERPAHNP